MLHIKIGFSVCGTLKSSAQLCTKREVEANSHYLKCRSILRFYC